MSRDLRNWQDQSSDAKLISPEPSDESSCDESPRDQTSCDQTSDDDLYYNEDFDGPQVESSDPDPFLKYSTCNICYKKLKMRCLSHVCLHKFCFGCIIQYWMATRKQPDRRMCPVCRKGISEIIMYPIPKDVQEWDSVKFKQTWLDLTSEFRKKIYSQNIWVQEFEHDVEFTSQFYRDNPSQVERLSLWLKREIQVLLNLCGSQITCDYLIQRILNLVAEYSIESQGFKSDLLIYLEKYIDHFIHEFSMFASSMFDIYSFDDHAVYYSNAEDGRKLYWNVYFDVQKKSGS